MSILLQSEQSYKIGKDGLKYYFIQWNDGTEAWVPETELETEEEHFKRLKKCPRDD